MPYNFQRGHIQSDTENSTAEVKLEKLKIAILTRVSREVLDATISTSEHIDFFSNDIGIKVRGYVWSEQIERHEIKYPTDWWQAFKERWFPVWAKRRWPVGYTNHVIDVKAIYPNFRPSLPDQECRIKIIY